MNTPTTVPLRFNADGFAAFLEGRREPAWLIAQRRQAWSVFEQMNWPDRREEEWMRTDIRLFKLDQFAFPVESSTDPCPPPFLTEGVTLAGATASLNGVASATRVDGRWTERGVVFGELDELLTEYPDLLRPYLERRLLDSSKDRFAALHVHAGRPDMCCTCRVACGSTCHSTCSPR